MADISPVPLTDFGAIMSSFGNGVAYQNATNARTNLDVQQAKVAQQAVQTAMIQNQQAALSYNLRRNALLNFSGQSDNSDITQPSQSVPAASASAPSGAAADPSMQPPPPPVGILPGSPLPSDDDIGSSLYNTQRVDEGLRQRFFVNPAGTPQEMAQISQAALSGDEGLLKYATARRDMGVLTRTAANQRDANSMYESLTNGVANAPAGRALDALDAVAPQLSTAIRKEHPDDPDAQDEAARDSTSHLAAILHQYTGRSIDERKDGTYVDSVTKQPLPATPHSGMSSEQVASVLKDANELITKKNSDGSETQEPRYKVAGYENAAQYLHAVGDQYRAQMIVPPVEKTSLGTQRQKLVAAAAKVDAVNRQVLGPQTGQPGAQPGPQGPAPGGPMAIALQDKSFRSPIANQPVQSGVSQSAINKGLTDTYVAQRKELQDAAGENAAASSQSLASFKAAQAILNAPDGSNIAGVLPGALAQELAKLGFNTDTGARRIEAAKYLTNGALQNLKTVYGAKPGVFDVKVNLDQAFPNIATMNDQSIKDLVASQIRNASYIRDSALRVPMFLAAKNEPSSFNSWNEKYFTRSDAVNNPQPTRPGQSSSGPQAKPDSGGFIPGRQYKDKAGNSATYLGNGKWQ